VAESFDPGALLGSSYPLQDGTRIRLRLARLSDGQAICALIARHGGASASPELEAARLVHHDPRRRCVLAATALLEGRETLVGVGSIPLDGREDPDPDLVVTDGRVAGAVGELLRAALIGRARAIARAARRERGPRAA
jgi:hypothetical protein